MVEASTSFSFDVASDAWTVTEELVELTATDCGLVACAVAVLVTEPASTLAWVTVYVPVQVSDAPGASVESGQLTVATLLSVTPMLDSVVVPVFLTRYLYGMVSPAAPYPVDVVDLASVSFDVAREASTVTEDGSDVTATDCGLVPVPSAELVTEPASTSAWVTV